MEKRISYVLPFLLLFAVSANAQFIQNKGQVLDVNQNLRPEVQFYYGAPEASIYFQKDKVVYAFQKRDVFNEKQYENDTRAKDSVKAKLGFTMYRLDMEFVGANPNPTIVYGEKIPGDIHFYLNKRNGIRDVGSYKTITYKNIYNNIDVIFYELPTGLKYDIVLREGGNIEDVKIFYNGAESIHIENKKVIIETNYKTLEEAIPLAFVNGDKSNEIEIEYILDDTGILSFKKPATEYNTLTIDPVLEWATYFNGTAAASGSLSYDQNHLDDQGNFYIYGIASNSANNYPVISPGGSAYIASYNAGYDLYLAKFNANRALVWSTYLGGSSSEYTYGANCMASRGNVLHIVGEGMSAGAPFTNGGGFYQAIADRNFWARFDITTGQLQHLTTLGGGYKPSIAVSNNGLVAIIKDAYDFNNPVVLNRAGAFNQATNGGFRDMFLMMFNTSYAQTWGTFLGGPGTQENFSCTFDNNENLYFVGENNWSSSSSNATTEKLVNLPGAYYQSTIAGGTDVTLGKFNTAGALVWHTLYGGNNSDARQGQQGGFGRILIHPTTQEIVLLFNTTSTNLTTVNVPGAYNKTVPTHASFAGSSGSFWNYAAYISKFSTAGALNYASYWYNTTDGDLIFDATFSGCDKLYIAGRVDYNTAVTQPLTGGFNLPNGQQTFVMQMNSSTYASEWTSFLANNASMQPSISGLSSNPRAYISANGYYDNGPTVNPGNGAYYQANNINQPAGNPTAFAYNYMIWQLHPSLPPQVTGDLAPCSGSTTTLTASGGTGAPYNWYAASSGGTAFYTGATYITPTLMTDVTYYVSSGSGMCESPRTPVSITVAPGGGALFTVTGGGSYCAGGAGFPVGLNGSQSGVSYQLYLGGMAQGTPVSGNGSSISFGVQTNAGTYTVATAGGGACSTTMTGSVAINVIATPSTPNFTVNSPVCSGSAINFNAPTVAGATYVWNGPNGFSSNLEDPSITISTTTNSGTYNLYIVENTCTSGTASQTVTVNAVPNTPSFTTNSPICAGSNLNLTGPTVASATYVWSGPNSFSSAVQSPSITNASVANSGTYNLSVVVAGCTSSVATQNVVINPSPIIAVGTITPPTSCGGNNGSVQITGTGTGSIGWTGTSFGGSPSTTLPYTMNNLAAGTYNTIFVANGCTSNVVVSNVVSPGAPATPTFTVNSPVCAGTTILLDATPVNNATYVWSGPNAFSATTEDVSIPSATAANAGNYNLYVIVSNCTSATATQNLVVTPSPPTPTFSVNSPICEGANLNFTTPAVSGGTYLWSGPNSFTSGIQNPSIASAIPTHSGTYNLNVIVNSCTSATATQNVVVNPTPVIAQGTVTNPTGCGSSNGSIQITGTGNGNIGWTGTTTGFNLAVTLPHTINSLAAGSYNIAFISAAGCTSNVVMSTLTNPAAPGTPSFTTNTPVCEGGNIQLNATPIANATYVWSGPNAFTSALSNPTVSPATIASAGSYSLYVVVNNCTSASATQNILVNPTPATPNFTHNAPLCSGSTLNLNAPNIAGASYFWNGPNSFASLIEDPSIVSATAAATGNYNLYVVLNGCTSTTATQAISVYDIPPAPIASSNAPLCEGGTLSLTANANGATNYFWNGPNAWVSTTQNPSINNVSSNENGTYNVYSIIGTCTSATASLVINITPNPIVTYTGPSNNCGNQLTLSATSNPTAGTTLNWFTPLPAGSGNSINHTYTGNLPGSFTGWVVASNNNCSDTAYFTIQMNDVPIAQFSAQDMCDSMNITLHEEHDWTGNGGTPSFSWTWNGGTSISSDPQINFAEPGTYPVTLTVTNAGTTCSSSITNNVVILPIPTLNFTYESYCLQEVQFTGIASPDSTLMQWSWNFGDGDTVSGKTISHTYDSPGNYTVLWNVLTNNNCPFSASQDIDVKKSSATIPDGLPNIFTPNGDAVNNEIDFDDIIGECGDYEIVIYNRWGSPVFTQQKGTPAFIGKTKSGTDLSAGVYFYVIKYGEAEKNGNITLVR